MTQWLKRSKAGPIGLDLGTHSFKAVQMRPSASGWQVASSLSLARVKPGEPLTAAEIERVRDVLDRRGFVDLEVVLAVPSPDVLAAILELPARAPGVPIDRIAEAEFGRVHKLDAAALTMATWDLPAASRASRATFMMAVGAGTAALDAHVGIVEAGGLNVVSVDEPYSAAGRGATHDAPPAAGLTAVIDLGWDAARLGVLHGGKLAYTRKLADAGLSHAVRAVADMAGGDAAEINRLIYTTGLTGAGEAGGVADVLSGHLAATQREIGQAFGYVARQYPESPLADVRLVGGGAAIPGLADWLGRALKVPTRAAGTATASPALALAVGLALAGGDR